MGAGRDQADVPISLPYCILVFVAFVHHTSRIVISLDDHQTSIFALRSSVGLQRGSSESGQLGQILFEPRALG